MQKIKSLWNPGGEGGVGAWLSFGVYGNGLECGSVRSGSSGTVEI